MRKLTFLAGALVLAGALFGAGWHFDHLRRAIHVQYIEPVTDKRLEDAAHAVQILHCLDSGNTNAIRDSQQLVMVLSLLHVDSLLPYSDSRSRALANELLREIAKSRAQGAPSFTGQLSNLSEPTLQQFGTLLKRASENQNK
jgi:hypothetical protein